jgi:tyrosyl-tRNA synthetase
MPTTVLTAADFADGAIGLLDLMVKCGLAASKGEARRLVDQGGVALNGDKVTDNKLTITQAAIAAEEHILKKGKKVFHKVIVE